MSEEIKNTEELSMDAIDQSFDTFKDEDEAAWDTLAKYLEEKTNLTVTVESVASKGVVATVEGKRGFVPASKLALARVDDLNEYLGKEIEVRVTEIDKEKNRLILSARDILREKANEERKARVNAVAVGSVLEGTVETLQPYGAFIRLADGMSGLVHVSQISTTRIKDPSAVLKVGDPVTVKVIAVKDGKLSLSIKALSDDKAAAEEDDLRNVKIPKAEKLSTSLGDLLKDIKF